ncbi:MAG: FAD-binding oxidoreductase, partial [Candidatus Limnocylindria bacterium]
EYDAARTVFRGGVDKRPALIVRVADAEDVARVIALARETGLELAVRSGGHSSAGHCVTEGGIVLDLSAMKGLEIDVAGRTAWAETGLTAVELTTALSAHGLAVGFGDTGSVGIGGITLGGGIGLLARKFGMTIDSLLAADIVTADGELIRADENSHPDLFWAIRGGGGNFGVATRFKYRLSEVPQVLGWMLIQPATADTIAAFIAEAEKAPDELTTIANIMQCPPLPFVAEEHHGKLVNFAFVVYAGDTAAGERALAPIRAIAPPIADLIKPISLPEIYPPEEGEYHPLAADRTMFLDRVDRQVAKTIVDRTEEHVRTSGAQMAGAQLRVLGGALARVPADATAYALRSSRIMVNLFSIYGAPAEAPTHDAWVAKLGAELEQGDKGAYVNFLSFDGADRIRAAYPGKTWDRLRAIKRRYDPTNFFRLNQNIPPA